MAAKAIAVDPGSSSGIAVLTERDEIVTMTLDTSEGDIEGVLALLLEQTPDVVIVERFITSGMMSRYGLHTVELVGAIKALQHLAETILVVGTPNHVFHPFQIIFRTPSQRKVRVPAAKAMLAERRVLGMRHTDHEVDALAHLLGWIASIEGA